MVLSIQFMHRIMLQFYMYTCNEGSLNEVA